MELERGFVINGVYQWTEGKNYTGSKVNNKMSGNGKLMWKDEKCYEGEFKDDRS